MQSQQNNNFQQQRKDHFAKLFPELPPLELSDRQLWVYAERMNDWGRWDRSDSTTITNGLGIFSQFLAHDITFDANSRLRKSNQLSNIQNDRTVNLDLDCLYGQRTQDFYYDKNDKAKLLLGECYTDGKNEWYDLQRNAQGKAIIPDSRNDENIIVSRMQVLFIQFHNCMVDHLRATTCPTDEYAAARLEVLRYYHWLIIHEYLYKMLDRGVYNSLMKDGAQYYKYPLALPLEFSGAAFRVGHSQTQDVNKININTAKKLFELGFFSTMEEYVDWHCIFDFGNEQVQYARRIDTQIARSFGSLPFVKIKDKKEKSLAFRNLRRSVAYGLPSGERVAMRMGYEPIEVWETQKLGLDGTPLWFYILREADKLGNEGDHLGPVGSRLLGEVF
ncbi:MAG: peroxidase family protein, partial [Bacteroidota bacterium]